MEVLKIDHYDYAGLHPNTIAAACHNTLKFFRDEVVSIEVYPSKYTIGHKTEKYERTERLITQVLKDLTPARLKYKIIDQEWLFKDKEKYEPKDYCTIFYTLFWIYYHLRVTHKIVYFKTTLKNNTVIITHFTNEKT